MNKRDFNGWIWCPVFRCMCFGGGTCVTRKEAIIEMKKEVSRW